MKKIISVIGARPNFMKIAPLQRALLEYSDKISHKLCHTGQHFDNKMSQVFFDELELPKPDFFLGIGGGSHATQTAGIMVEFEKICLEEKPDMVVVVGDVNSTIACGMVAAKLGIQLAHIEAGLRSFDKRMPEEINRILTDSISDILFVSEKSGEINLKNEGVDNGRVFFVGNIMIDTLIHLLPKVNLSSIKEKLKINEDYILATFHRPSNVDNPQSLSDLIKFLNYTAGQKKVIFPVHPRTLKNLETFDLNTHLSENLIFTDPLGYTDFINLMKDCAFVLTDSGGIQEESTYLGVQCLTLRENTERPSTVELGTNIVVGTEFESIRKHTDELLSGKVKQGVIPPLWDGNTAIRIANIIAGKLLA